MKELKPNEEMLQNLVKEFIEVFPREEEETECCEDEEFVRVRVRIYRHGAGVLISIQPMEPFIEISNVKLALDLEIKEIIKEVGA